ncbi:MAG: three-Cys-motif partner protein TcmP [Polaribacter sp.]
MNNFGGNWTENKIEILVEYAKAYLTIMNKHKYFKPFYFDGFAGSGFIKEKSKLDKKTVLGAAKRIIDIEEPIPFEQYYFVEKDEDKFNSLKKATKDYRDKKIYVVNTDCNDKLKSLSKFLQKKRNKNTRVLAYIDPCGMQLEWSSIECLKNLGIDFWVLVPTGLGVNRLLKKNGEISDAWLSKLEVFLGMNREEIKNVFYEKSRQISLFGDERFDKVSNAIEKSADLYKNRLHEIFSYISEAYVLKNSSNSIMFHFFMASNNKFATKIANDIIKKYNKANV